MVEDYAAIPVIDSGTLARHEALPAIELLGSEAGRPMLETPNERWRHSDEIVFDALELTHGERDAVYEAVIALVEARLGKAGSV